MTTERDRLLALEAERDAARDELAALSSFLGCGWGEEDTPLSDYVARVKHGVDAQCRMLEKEMSERRRWHPIATAPLPIGVPCEEPVLLLFPDGYRSIGHRPFLGDCRWYPYGSSYPYVREHKPIAWSELLASSDEERLALMEGVT